MANFWRDIEEWQVRTRLAAGGKRIRTSGPTLSSSRFCGEEPLKQGGDRLASRPLFHLLKLTNHFLIL
jgi:hypothetical protein